MQKVAFQVVKDGLSKGERRHIAWRFAVIRFFMNYICILQIKDIHLRFGNS